MTSDRDGEAEDLKITVLTVGKPKDRCLAELAERYLSRMRPFAPVALESVAESRDLQPERKIDQEGEAITRALRDRDFVVVLDEKGTGLDSVSLSNWLENTMKEEPGRIVFVIGGAFGLSERVMRRSAFSLSLSAMTLPHELCLVFFLEQLYRAFSIIKGTKYHH